MLRELLLHFMNNNRTKYLILYLRVSTFYYMVSVCRVFSTLTRYLSGLSRCLGLREDTDYAVLIL